LQIGIGGMRWEDLVRRVTARLTLMKKGQYLILIVRSLGFDGPPLDPNHYAQFAHGGEDGLLAEAVSNRFLADEARLDAGQELRLLESGWKPPEIDGTHRSRHPNYYRTWNAPVPFDEAANLAVTTLRGIYWASEPADLVYKAFNREGDRFVWNDLGLDLDQW
jgi:hypothetical protein